MTSPPDPTPRSASAASPGSADRPPHRHAGRRLRLLRAAALAFGVIVPVAALAVLIQSKAAGVHELDEAAIRAATEITRENPALYRALLVWQ